MTLSRGRVVRAPMNAVLVETAHGSGPHGRRVPREEVAAMERAEVILGAATRRAAAILKDAEQRAGELRAQAVDAGRAEGFAETAALSLAVRKREEHADEAALDRVVELARLLAERLLGQALVARPDVVIALASQTLAEAGGARRVELRAHPLDAAVLSLATSTFDPLGRVHAVVADDCLARGDLRLNTELGMIDAHLGSELTRLAERLREALRT